MSLRAKRSNLPDHGDCFVAPLLAMTWEGNDMGGRPSVNLKRSCSKQNLQRFAQAAWLTSQPLQASRIGFGTGFSPLE
jgi:hypothetical protein